MRPLRLAFSDFYPGFDPRHNQVERALAATRAVTVVAPTDAPDLLVYSDFGTDHWASQGLKVYLTGENMLPDFDQCDLAFTPFEVPGDPRAVRLPYYAQALGSPGNLVRPPSYDASAALDRPGFCAFVVSNPKSPERNRFFRLLNRRRRVDSGGRHFNNMGGPVANKLAFISGYRFTIAFENTSSPGYITEKLVEPLLAGSIPIYWGDPEVGRDFDPACMINVSRFPSFEAAADHVLALDADREARRRLLQAPVFRDNALPECVLDEYVRLPIEHLLDSGTAPGRRRYRKRRLRQHVYGSWIKRRQVSLSCRFDVLRWRMGWRG